MTVRDMSDESNVTGKELTDMRSVPGHDPYPVHCIYKEEKGFPGKLLNYPHMPGKLYYRGNLPDPDKPSIAIVGARMCSPYGRLQAFRYARAMSEKGIQVISGLATGIDSEGHKGALEGKTPTFAVLGNGVDVVYPRSNKSLYMRILRTGGGILSEYPPGEKPRSYNFPARNRIISALSDVVLVVEAKEKSGSLITAGYALEQGKTVYAVPGQVIDELSRGCHKLIFDGAGIAYDPDILLLEWGINEPEQRKNEQKKDLGLAEDLKLLYSYLDSRPASLDSLIRRSRLPASQVSNSLVELCLMGLAMESPRHYYIRV